MNGPFGALDQRLQSMPDKSHGTERLRFNGSSQAVSELVVEAIC